MWLGDPRGLGQTCSRPVRGLACTYCSRKVCRGSCEQRGSHTTVGLTEAHTGLDEKAAALQKCPVVGGP